MHELGTSWGFNAAIAPRSTRSSIELSCPEKKPMNFWRRSKLEVILPRMRMAVNASVAEESIDVGHYFRNGRRATMNDDDDVTKLICIWKFITTLGLA